MAEDKGTHDGSREVSDRTTRREVLKRAGVGAATIVYGGAFAKTSVAGVPQYRGQELKETLRIIQWSHFVPAYDKWFDNVYIKRWGEANDTEVDRRPHQPGRHPGARRRGGRRPVAATTSSSSSPRRRSTRTR